MESISVYDADGLLVAATGRVPAPRLPDAVRDDARSITSIGYESVQLTEAGIPEVSFAAPLEVEGEALGSVHMVIRADESLTVLAALQRRSGVAIGTIIGSNTFNILAIMGIGSVISPSSMPVSSRVLTVDLPVMLAVSSIPVLYA